MRVAMVVPRYPPAYGGAGLQAARLAAALGRRGVEVHVLTSGPPAPSTDLAGEPGTGSPAAGPAAGARAGEPMVASPRIVRFRSPEGLRGLDLALGPQAAAWLLTHRWDLLHIHTVSYFAVPPAWVARALGRPYLLKTSLLGGDDLDHVGRGRLGSLLTTVYRRAAAVVALSDAIEQALRADASVRGRPIRIPNGVDLETFRPPDPDERTAARYALDLDEGEAAVLTTSRLSERKDVGGLVEAVARMSTRPLRLLLAGPTEPRSDATLRSALAALPTGVRVSTPGHVDATEVPTWMRAADAFVLNSTAEGLPNALLEAMASGLACVATDIPGTRDLLGEETALGVPPGDSEALASALDRLLSDPDLRVRLGTGARRRVARDYDLERVAERYVDLYREIA